MALCPLARARLSRLETGRFSATGLAGGRSGLERARRQRKERDRSTSPDRSVPHGQATVLVTHDRVRSTESRPSSARRHRGQHRCLPRPVAAAGRPHGRPASRPHRCAARRAFAAAPRWPRSSPLDERATLRVIGVLVDAGYLDKRDDSVVVAHEVRSLLDPADDAFVGDRLRPPPRPACGLAAAARGTARGRSGRLERTLESRQAFIGSMRGRGASTRPAARRAPRDAVPPRRRPCSTSAAGRSPRPLAFKAQGWQVTVLDFPEVIDLMADELFREPASPP